MAARQQKTKNTAVTQENNREALLIFAAHVNARLAVSAGANPQMNGFAAHLAILDILLATR